MAGDRGMRIAVDLDDVVLDFVPGVVKSLAIEYGIEFKYHGVPWAQEVVDLYTHPVFIASGYKDWWGWLRDRDWLWATFPAVPGAIGGIKQLRVAGHYVECLTSKPEWAEHCVWKWFSRWRPAFNRVTIVEVGQSKWKFSDADVLIDDKEQACIEWVESEPWRRRAIHFLHNAEDFESPRISGVYRAYDWEQVLQLIDDIQEGELT